ncbi:M949_RS01915 family surface polysaccharide biosynthesis protein [Burkholderia pyrrocinia]|uniref:M949_RS01915 family surface polysaccharide biosynthesis protein n=1 Tax=Burkholderia pyrrocinia TaxID=60550 RepID=UPI001BD1BA10|nr:hypothetical protein [Burkholderia pyrrocinia]QVN23334.1 hypothetical protein JYG32_33090 [Burkholderia pyrrocinia]
MPELKAFAFAVIALVCTSTCARTNTAPVACPADAPFLAAESLKKTELELRVFKRYCYTDKSGSYVLVLAEKQDRPFVQETLSSFVRATLYKIGSDMTLTQQWTIRDFAAKGEAGVNFRSKLIEVVDLDGDGLFEPIVVYQFFNFSPDKDVDASDYTGRIKIVTFRKGEKVTIQAITGELDRMRRTTANSNYFALPKPARQYLVDKMAAMYKTGQFGFDNSYDFKPRKE